MGADIQLIYVEKGINSGVLAHWCNVNAWLFWDEPETVVERFEYNLLNGHYGPRGEYVDELDSFWDVEVTEGKDAVAVVLPGNRYICIERNDPWKTLCSNMKKNTRRKWKKRIVTLIKENDNGNN